MNVFAVIVVLIVALVVLLQLGMWWRTRRQVGRPAPDTTSLTGTGFGKNERALFYFYNQNCGACKPMTPLIRELKEQRKHIYSLDIGEHPGLARKFGLLATPTVFVVENGHIAQVRLGTLSRKQLDQLL